MSYQEKNTIVSILSSTLVFFGYYIYIINTYSLQALLHTVSTKDWAIIILIMIPISVVGRILASILHIIYYKITSGEEAPDFTDERDRIIELKGTRNSHYLFITGFFLGIIALALGNPISYMFIICLFVGYLSDVFADVSMFFWYRRGF